MTASDAVYLGFDLGASSGRAALGFLARGRLRIEELHRFPNAPVPCGGTLYWDVLAIWSHLVESLRRAAERGLKALDGVGVDTWGVDFGLLGRDGRLIGNPLCYRDGLTEGIERVIERAVGGDVVYRLTGLTPSRVATLSQLVAMRRGDMAERLKHAHALLMMPDLFRYFLCGHRAVERTAAGTSLFTNIRTGGWCPSLLQALDLPRRILPPIVPPATVAGPLSEPVRSAAGLDAVPVIAVAGHDTASAAAAVPFSEADTAFISSGTWSIVGVIRPAPIATPQARRLRFVNELGLESVLVARNMMGLYLFENLRRSLSCREPRLTYGRMVRAAGRAPAFARHLNIDSPLFFAAQDPARAAAEYLRQTGQKPLRAWPELARAILEGMAFNYRAAVRDLEALTGTPLRRICVVGGGSRNALLCRMAADATGIDVLAGPAEATLCGNLGAQALATGRIKNAQAIRELVRNSFELKRYKPRSTAAWDGHEKTRATVCGRETPRP
jgi:rhamnulokinase